MALFDDPQSWQQEFKGPNWQGVLSLWWWKDRIPLSQEFKKSFPRPRNRLPRRITPTNDWPCWHRPWWVGLCWWILCDFDPPHQRMISITLDINLILYYLVSQYPTSINIIIPIYIILCSCEILKKWVM